MKSTRGFPLVVSLGLIVLGMVVFAASPAGAATAAGPYYATPSWDQKLDCTTTANYQRFIVLTNWGSAAVLDRETGLVWEQSPSTYGAGGYFGSSSHCFDLNAGGRRGWRLPTLQELLSLVDQSVSNPALPSGHPFSNVQSSLQDLYWSATAEAGVADAVKVVYLFNAVVGNSSVNPPPYAFGFAWCVRGGQGADAQ